MDTRRKNELLGKWHWNIYLGGVDGGWVELPETATDAEIAAEVERQVAAVVRRMEQFITLNQEHQARLGFAPGRTTPLTDDDRAGLRAGVHPQFVPTI